ncbi:MAG: FAD-dependent monooxygenase [Legionella sp.]|nr:FAD-dependent monooxygenase [Legionella sp.]
MVSDHVENIDILVVGGGLTGALFMIALANKGYRCLLIDPAPARIDNGLNPEPRALALSSATVRILNALNVWPLVASKATPMQYIHVSEQGAFGATRLRGTEISPLGYVIEMQQLQTSVNTLLSSESCLKGVSILSLDSHKGQLRIAHAGQTRTLVAKLIVGADGSDSPLRQLSGLTAKTYAYHQYALAANVRLARDHGKRAYERFTLSGPLAFLPMQDKTMALVWTVSEDSARRLQSIKPDLFLSELQNTFGYRLGRFVSVGKRSIFPLKQVVMPTTIAHPVVFIGNAAQTLHPVAGQGFNLGLRDVATLAQCILEKGLSPEMLAAYQSRRRTDKKMVIAATHYLIQLFGPRFTGVKMARQLGLIALDLFPYWKENLVQYASGLGKFTFGELAPDLLCGIKDTPANVKTCDPSNEMSLL